MSAIRVGSRIRVDLADGRRVRGTLMHADAVSAIINPRVRVPEPPITVPMADVRGFEIEKSAGVGKAIAIGAAAGAAAALGVIWLIFAVAIND